MARYEGQNNCESVEDVEDTDHFDRNKLEEGVCEDSKEGIVPVRYQTGVIHVLFIYTNYISLFP